MYVHRRAGSDIGLGYVVNRRLQQDFQAATLVVFMPRTLSASLVVIVAAAVDQSSVACQHHTSSLLVCGW